jgi:cyd operon protein YbgT
MGYFAWALGVSLAASFAILNAMWFELDADRAPRLPANDAPRP